MKHDRTTKKNDPRAEPRLPPIIGIDLGQKRDPTAIAVAEIEHRDADDAQGDRSHKEAHYLIRFLNRLPLGTPYPETARRLGEIFRLVKGRAGLTPRIFVDATGVGAAVVDMLNSQVPTASLWAVTFTHGDRRTTHPAERKITLGKAFLVSRLQVLLQRNRLHLPQGSEARALAQELLTYEIKVDENAVDRYGAFRVGTHDDLVTALGLATQEEPDSIAYPLIAA